MKYCPWDGVQCYVVGCAQTCAQAKAALPLVRQQIIVDFTELWLTEWHTGTSATTRWIILSRFIQITPPKLSELTVLT